MLDQSCYKKADEIIAHYDRCAASLIPIMQDWSHRSQGIQCSNFLREFFF